MIRVNLLPPAPLPPPSVLSFTSFAQMARAIPNSAAHFAAAARQTVAEYRPRFAPLLFAGGAVAALADPSLSMSLLCGGLAIAVVYGINLPAGIVSTESYRAFRSGSRDEVLAAIEEGDFTAMAALVKTVSPNSADVANRLAELLQEDRERVLRILTAFARAGLANPTLSPFVLNLLKTFGEKAESENRETLIDGRQHFSTFHPHLLTVLPHLIAFAEKNYSGLISLSALLIHLDASQQKEALLRHLTALAMLTRSTNIADDREAAEREQPTAATVQEIQTQLREQLLWIAEANDELKPAIAEALGLDPADAISETTRHYRRQAAEEAELRHWMREEATPEAIVARIRQDVETPVYRGRRRIPQTTMAAHRIPEILYAALEEIGQRNEDLIASTVEQPYLALGSTIAIATVGETTHVLEEILEHFVPTTEQDLLSFVMTAIVMDFVAIHTLSLRNLAELGRQLAISAEILSQNVSGDEASALQAAIQSFQSYATGGPKSILGQFLQQAPDWVPRDS